MSSQRDKGCFLELNEHSLVAARTSSLTAPLVVEHIEEIRLENKTACPPTLSAIFPELASGGQRVICSVRPPKRFFHLASADEARKHGTAAAAKAFAAQVAPADSGPCDAAVCAQGGQLLDGKSGARWLLSGVSHESLEGTLARLREWQITPLRVEPATVSLLGACHIAQGVSKDGGPLLVWEVGENTSDLFVVTADGVEAARRVKFGFDQIVEAIATEINLKFKASAAKLFFNELYDFSESGPKIAARIASQLQPEISALALQSGKKPGSAHISGFPAKQAWFSQSLAQALSLSSWAPDVAAWNAKAGVKFADDAIAGSITPGWLGLLGTIAATRGDKLGAESAWHPVLYLDGSVPAAAPAAAPAPAPVAEKPAPVPVKREEPAKAAPVAAKPVAAPVPAKKEEPAKPVVVAAKVEPAKPVPAPVKKEEPKPVVAAVKKEEPKPVVAVARKDTPAPAKVEAKSAAVATSAQASGEKKKNFFATPAGMGIAAILVVFLGGGFFLFSQMQEAKSTADRDRKIAEQRAASDAEALRLAQQKAAEETAARLRAEQDSLNNATAADAARKQAEEEARKREEETRRLLFARGSLKLVTEPAAANIMVDNLAARQSPATFTDLRLGRYTAEISLEGFEATTIEVEVKENQVTNPGVVKLLRQTGSLDVSTDPAGVAYELRPTDAAGGIKKQGATPARLTGLPTGKYSVTLLRDGWAPHTETVVIERNGSARVTRSFSSGVVNITSFPQGASVFMNGKALGVTPLPLKDLPPGEATFTLELPDYHPTTISGLVEGTKPLDLSVRLEAVDRIARISELDVKPVAIKTVQPDVGTEQAKYQGKMVTVSLIVDKEGMPRDIKIDKATDDALAVKCLEAVSQWRFKPGQIRGEPVRARVTVPIVVR